MIVGIDPVGGASGDMFLSALADLGIDMEAIFKRVARYIPGEFTWEIGVGEKYKLYGKKVRIIAPPEKGHKRTFKKIKELTENTDFSERVKDLIISIFHFIAEAEARIHNRDIDSVHFHETGAVDSIVDIFSFALGWEELGFPESVLLRDIPLGKGYGVAQHGPIPYPAPATIEILKGMRVEWIEAENETITPTGAAIIKSLNPSYIPVSGVIVRSGIGIGDHDFKNIPNILRLVLLETEGEKDLIWVIETNIDDMTPQQISDLQERLLMDSGALDVYLYPVMMKKGRSGYKLEILVSTEAKERVVKDLFHFSTTIGMRERIAWRTLLPRKYIELETSYGKVRYKEIDKGDRKLLIPEFDDVRRIARDKSISTFEVYNELIKIK